MRETRLGIRVEGYFSILQGPEMGWSGWTSGGTRHKKEVVPKKKTCIIIGNYVEDVKQDEKHVPDLLESITRAPYLVKEELRPILFKKDLFVSKIQKIGVSTVWTPEIQSCPAGGQFQPSH